jgi:phospholipid/cholesterol/gamma-HCH transport system substrate-binding protein
MKSKQRRSLIVGVFITLGLIIFLAAIYLVGKKENLFGSTIELSAIFQDVKGLREGDKVRLSGIDIGNVSQIGLLPDNRVLIKMNLQEDQVIYVREDSRVTIANEGLMGAKVVMILPGSLKSDPVAAQDTLLTVEQIDIDDIMKEVKNSSENITVVSSELISITQKINRGDGIFGKIFTDTTFTSNLDETSENVTLITKNLIDISEKVNRGQGIVGKLFADTLLTSEIDSASQDLDQISQNIKEITQKINQGEGVFGRLFTDTSLTSNLFRTSQNLEYTTSNLLILTERLASDSSSLNLFIEDPAFADSLEILLFRINKGVVEATKASEAIQRSGLIRMFSKDKDEKDRKDQQDPP